MVSFQCDGCADTVKKPKLDQHRQRCWASFTCLDCSKTFQNQDYKSHTSCISEAEKYQGALYKGPKKGKNGAPTPVASTSAPPPPVEAPAPVPGPSVVPAAAAIHPSRLSQLAAPPTPDFPARGGGFERGRGRGRGFGRGGGGGYGGGSVRMAATGENSFTNPAGMRSWGSTPTIEESQPEASTSTLTIPIPITVLGEAEAERPKKKKKKGDKGGTGSKANSKRPRGESENASVAPVLSETENKKRKRSASPAPAIAQTNGDAEPSDKQLKKLRKNLGKLESKASSMQLDQFLKQVGEGKKDSIASTDVLKSLKVGFSEGKWVLTV